MGAGRGMGRGGGRGTGRGMGRGGAVPNSPPGLQPPPTPQFQDEPAGELDVLKAQARAVEEQLAALRQRMTQIGQGGSPVGLTAVVDPDRCTGCGFCVPVCPAGAIVVNAVAGIDPARCAACGRCVVECPQEAIALRKAG